MIARAIIFGRLYLVDMKKRGVILVVAKNPGDAIFIALDTL